MPHALSWKDVSHQIAILEVKGCRPQAGVLMTPPTISASFAVSTLVADEMASRKD
jgi:hypothetical protein